MWFGMDHKTKLHAYFLPNTLDSRCYFLFGPLATIDSGVEIVDAAIYILVMFVVNDQIRSEDMSSCSSSITFLFESQSPEHNSFYKNKDVASPANHTNS